MADGTLKSLFLKNFLTYGECEYVFNSGLNIIYGPNGTGKSSVIAAILLVFGGNVKNLNRSKDISDYIKYGEDSADVRLTIFNKGDEIVIRRKLSRNGGRNNIWYINEVKSSEKDLKNLRMQLAVDLDNLCNFMPQDRVSDFLRMDSQQLLVAFMETIEKEHFCTLRNQLVRFHTDRSDKNNLISASSKEFEILEKRLRVVSEEVKKYEKWKENQDRIKLLETKIHWIKYENSLKELNELKAKYNEAVRAHEQLSASLSPQQIEQKKVKKIIKKIGESFFKKKSIFISNLREFEAKREEIEKNKREVDKANVDFNEIHKAIKENNEKINFTQINLDSLNSDYYKIEAEFSEKANRLQMINLEIEEITSKIEELEKESNTINIEIDKNQNAGKLLKQTLNSDLEKRKQILESVRNHDQDSYRAMEWLKNNKRMFKSEFYGPLLYHINLKNQIDAKYLENHFSNRDLFAFVTDCSEDVHTFISNVREKMGLRVSCLLTDPNSEGTSFPDIQTFKKYKFRCFLKDLFEAPKIPMSYLLDTYAVHQIPIFEKLSPSELESVMKIPNISCFFVADEKYILRISNYSKLPSVRSFQLINYNFMVSVLPGSKIKEISNEIESFTSQIEKFQKNLDSIRNKIEKCKGAKEELQSERSNIMNLQRKAKALKSHIYTKKIEIESYQNSIKIFENQLQENSEKKLKFVKEVSISIFNLIKNINEFQLHAKKFLKEHLTLYYNVSYLKYIESKLEGVNNLLQCQQEQIEILKSQYDIKRSEIKIIQREAKEASGIKNNEEVSSQLSQSLSDLPHNITEIQTKITELQIINSSSYCFDPNIVSKYKDLKVKIAKSEDNLKKIKNDLSRIETEESEIKKKWIDGITKSIHQVSKTFSEFFSLIKCKGELELIKDPDDNYEKYALGIKVSYRSDENMIQLNNLRHSGGEKAVAIMLFLMSMQQLSRSPFKMIDEINQGMDASNEKIIIEVMMNTISKFKATRQYFFLSPKVMPDIEYDGSVTIHIIFNGIILETSKNISN